MTRKKATTPKPERRYIVRGVRREPPDIRKLGKVLLAVALAEQQQGTEPAQEGAG